MKKRVKPGRFNGEKKKGEQGTIIKRGKGLIKTALVYPNTYSAGMSSLGFQTVYREANKIDNVSCERVFWSKDRSGKRPLKSIESGFHLNQFDIILASISFENDFFHLVQLLGEAGIPLRSPDRNHIHPLVVAGGVACFLNPEPIAPFVDCFLLGEAECLLPNFFDQFSKSQTRSEFLDSIESQIPGSYCPSCHGNTKQTKIQVQYLKDLTDIKTTSSIISSDTAFKDIFLIETLKGCPHGCRFCSAGFIYRPPRIYPEKNILEAIDEAKDKTDKIGLVSSAVADHPQINAICEYALKKNLTVSFSSLRADKLDKNLITSLKNSKVKTATIAPEAGSERMRNVINKKLTREQILGAVRKLVANRIINIRLYFMIGLPFEQIEDIHAIVKLTLAIKAVFLEESKKNKKIGTITLSINPFIPKPATPFQWAVMDTEDRLKKKADILRNGLKNIPNVKLNFESFRKAKIHGLLSLGDQKMADVLEIALAKNWATAIKQHSDYCHDLIYREKSVDEYLPWDFIDNKIKKDFLVEEFHKAKHAQKSVSCPMSDCSRCKICMTI